MSDTNFIDNYLNWLKSNMTEEKLDNGLIEITTPFLDKNNDYTQIYVEKKSKNKLLLTDYGYIIDELHMVGIDTKSPKRKDIIESILNRFGIKLIDEKLTIECLVDDFPNAKHRLIQAMLAVDDLFYTSRPNVTSIFFEEVEKFFVNNDIYHISNINFTGIAGYTHNYEFALQKSKNNPERLIKLANNLNKSMAESILFAWNDTRVVRNKKSVLYTIINDTNKINDKYINALESYEVVPIPWSRRNEYLERFA